MLSTVEHCIRKITVKIHAARVGLVERLLVLMTNGRGATAVEFAIIAPVLLVLLLSLAEIVPAVAVRFKVDHTAQVLGDLTSQLTQLQTQDMENIYATVPEVMAPFASSNLSQRVTSVYSDGAGTARIYWSCGQGSLPPYTARAIINNTPTGEWIGKYVTMLNSANGYDGAFGNYVITGTNSSAIMAETSYGFTSNVRLLTNGTVTLKSARYFQPRRSIFIGFPWDGDSSHLSPAPTSTTSKGSLTLSNGAVCNYAK